MPLERVAVERDAEDPGQRLRDQKRDREDDRPDDHQQGAGEPARRPQCDAADDENRGWKHPEKEYQAADREVARDLLAPARAEEARRALEGVDRARSLDRDHRDREEGDQRPADVEDSPDNLADYALVL